MRYDPRDILAIAALMALSAAIVIGASAAIVWLVDLATCTAFDPMQVVVALVVAVLLLVSFEGLWADDLRR